MNVLRIFIHILELTGLRFIVNYRTTKIESNKDQMWNWHYYLHLLYYTLFLYLEDNYLSHFIFLQSSLLFLLNIIINTISLNQSQLMLKGSTNIKRSQRQYFCIWFDLSSLSIFSIPFQLLNYLHVIFVFKTISILFVFIPCSYLLFCYLFIDAFLKLIADLIKVVPA